MNEEFFRMFLNKRLVSVNTELNEENKKLLKRIEVLEATVIMAFSSEVGRN